ncbi:FAD/FMN-containing dehydrogenase [Sunxiuqinia elliptica]|uniref:FAD/FMN-containing dehydrogenase n=2 Tax=Sunxiuqinia elliptica TaxID=655355 RepID=A0A4R6HAN0_9BACT|nr:FAD/FMN-containing dehydrogenase [Sunxiuqinia elliptica]TDO64967.1 FAD/FMN-containing dehydrogenase [Sunxiuqinia elliptica]
MFGMKESPLNKFSELSGNIAGDVYTDRTHRILYATDASSYRELPQAVTRPKNKNDIKNLIAFASRNRTSIIPRGAGTSLAGQVVGPGIVVDVSKYMNRILELNTAERWVWVEPGVVLAELNQFLAPHGLQFGPETSTANRCVIGGMLGNNSCGLHSLVYGSVRDHILEVETILSDGSEVTFRELSTDAFEQKCKGHPDLLETKIYNKIHEILSVPENQAEIRKEFPDPRIRRRNNGYALDILLETDPFTGNGQKINVSKLLAGSEGTLAFSTKIKLNLIPLPKKYKGLVCAHFTSMQEAAKANIIALNHQPVAIELTDDYILNCTKDNIEQRKNRFFIQGEPKVVLFIEFESDDPDEIHQKARQLELDLKNAGYGYHFPLYSEAGDIAKLWDLRKAGLGVLLNIPGDKRSVQVIEDTAVHPEVYPEFITEVEQILQTHQIECAYYAHLATGELHLSPLLNLKDSDDVATYYKLAKGIALLVKKYRGSLSGEHGDGRLRGEFIPLMLGEHNYRLLKELKKAWDPDQILNPGKITDTPSIVENMRYLLDQPAKKIETSFPFPEKSGLLYAAEKCSGSGDCRKSSLIGGTMCPTFMATRDEDKTTRGRANLLREFLTRSDKKNPFDHRELYEVMDLCLSCKACKSECPSNVDMAKLKAEFLQHYYENHSIPLRTRLIAYLPRLNRLGMAFRPMTNFLTGNNLFKQTIGFAKERSVPALSKITLKRWDKQNHRLPKSGKNKKVYLFADEFTNFNESEIGIKTILLLNKLGYEVVIPKHIESGRTFLSKGLLKTAKKVAAENVALLKDLVTDETPLVGIEPSAILTFRDEYPELLNGTLQEAAASLAKNALMLDEFITREAAKGLIRPEQFTTEPRQIKLHGHCQQKAIASTEATKKMLSLPVSFRVEEIKSGCCGMAGSFGYEKEHYELSMRIGELVLFPEVRKTSSETRIAAPGTSCRHQIKDGTGKQAQHPVEILLDAIL